MNTRKSIACVLVYGTICLAIILGAPLIIFLDFYSALFVLGMCLGGIGISHSPAHVGDALKTSFTQGSLQADQAHQAAAVFERLSSLATGTGMLGPLLGLVMMLQNLDDPSHIGPAMAVALLTLFYSLILSELVFRSAAADCLARSLPARPTRDRPLTLPGRKLLGGLVMLGVLLLGSMWSTPIDAFFDIPCLVIVLVIPGAGIFLSHSFAQVREACGLMLGVDPLEEAEALESAALFTRLAELAVAAGLAGTVIGLVQMLQQLDDPTKIGPAMAVALLCLFYGVILSECVYRTAAGDCLKRAGLPSPNTAQNLPTGRTLQLLGTVFMVLLTFFVMLLAMADFSGPADRDDNDSSEHLPSIEEEFESDQ